MTQEQDFAMLPEDGGDGLFDRASVVRELLKAPVSFEETLINGRLQEQDANAYIDTYILGLKYRQAIIVQGIPTKITATTGKGGLARIEATSAVNGNPNNSAYEIAKSSVGGFKNWFRKCNIAVSP